MGFRNRIYREKWDRNDYLSPYVVQRNCNRRVGVCGFLTKLGIPKNAPIDNHEALVIKMKNKEALAWFIIIFLFFAGFYLFGRYRMSKDNPPFLIPKFQALMNDIQLMDSIGGSTDFEWNFSQIEFHSKDTLRSTIKIVGSKRTLHYNAVHLRATKGENKWVLINEQMMIQ